MRPPPISDYVLEQDDECVACCFVPAAIRVDFITSFAHIQTWWYLVSITPTTALRPIFHERRSY